MSAGSFANMTWKKIAATVSGIMLLGGLIGGWIWFDSYFAHASDVKRVEKKVDKHELKDDIRWYQDQKTYLKSQHGAKTKYDLPDAVLPHYEYYEREQKALEEELKILMGK